MEIINAINSMDMPYLIDLGILDRKIGIDFRINEDGLHPLMLASKYDNPAMVQFLLSSPSARIHMMDY